MRAAQINDLSGSYGNIQNQRIWDLVAVNHLDMLITTLMIEGSDGKMMPDPEAGKPETREFVMSKGIGFGICRVPQWTGLNEGALATALHNDLLALGLDNHRHPAADPCYVVANAELHSFDLVTFLSAWRRNRPTRATGWAIEGGQGGRLSDTVVAKANSDTFLTTFGEAYSGPVGSRPDMYPVAADFVKDNLRERGLKRVKIVYDGKPGAPDWMDGIIFTLERLP